MESIYWMLNNLRLAIKEFLMRLRSVEKIFVKEKKN